MNPSELRGIKTLDDSEKSEFSLIDYQDIKVQTKKAILLFFDSDPEEEWFPKSQLRKSKEKKNILLWVSDWLLEQKND